MTQGTHTMNLRDKVARALRDADPIPMSMFDDDDLRDLAQAAINAIPDTDLVEENERLKALLGKTARLLLQYRSKVPLGHQPHMIAHVADEALDEAHAALEQGK